MLNNLKELHRLYKILMGEMMMLEKKGDTKRSKMEWVLSIFVVLFVFVPFMFLIGFFTYFLADGLSMTNTGYTFGSLVFLCIGVSILCVLFGFSVLMHTLFFSADTTNLLPLPLSHNKIVGAKFLVCLQAENVMQILILIAGFAGYLITIKPSVIVVCTAIICVLTLPIIPLCYCAIISILLMRFTGFIKNKKVAIRISGVLTLVLIILLIMKATSVNSNGLDGLVISLETCDSGAIKALLLIFPNIYCLNLFGASHNPLWIIGYVVCIIVFFALFELITKFFYIDALNNVTAHSNKRGMNDDALKGLSQKELGKTLFIRELKALYRSPVFLSSCILVNLFWPVLAVFIVKMNFSVNGLATRIESLYTQTPSVRLLFLCVIIGAPLFISSINSICSSAFSREGKVCFQYLKSLPVSTRKLMQIKTLTGVFISSCFVIIYYVAFALIFTVPTSYFILGLILYILCITLSSFIGIYIDAMHPSVLWEEESHVLRGNLNTFMAMVVCIMVFFAIIAIDWFLMFRMNSSIVATTILDIIILAWMNFAFYVACFTKGVASIINFH